MQKHVASINVDPQKGFTPLCPDELPVPEGDQIVPELLAQNALAVVLAGSSDAHCEQALFRVDSDEQQFKPLDYPHTDCTFKLHCQPGTLGFELLDGLPHYSDYDFFVYKGVAPDMHPYGACYHDLAETLSTGLIEFLHYRGINTVLVGGLATDFCVATTAKQLQAANHFTVIVNLAACRGISAQGVAEQVEQMQQAGILIMPDSQAISSWLSNQKDG